MSFEALKQAFEGHEGWFVYYTAAQDTSIYRDAVYGRRREREYAGTVAVWARHQYEAGKVLMSQRKTPKGETEYLLRAK